MDGIAKGIGDLADLGAWSKRLGEQRRAAQAELANVPASENVITLHPATLARYEQQLSTLQEALAKGIRSGDTEAAAALRDLIDAVTVFRDRSRPGGLEVEIAGRLNALIDAPAYPLGVRGSVGKVVAGEGFEPPTKGL